MSGGGPHPWTTAHRSILQGLGKHSYKELSTPSSHHCRRFTLEAVPSNALNASRPVLLLMIVKPVKTSTKELMNASKTVLTFTRGAARMHKGIVESGIDRATPVLSGGRLNLKKEGRLEMLHHPSGVLRCFTAVGSRQSKMISAHIYTLAKIAVCQLHTCMILVNSS